MDIIVLIEAEIDFGDEEVTKTPRPSIAKQIRMPANICTIWSPLLMWKVSGRAGTNRYNWGPQYRKINAFQCDSERQSGYCCRYSRDDARLFIRIVNKGGYPVY
jgi:hypothetical protein